MQRESRIEDADGILSVDFGELVDLVVVRVINRDGVNFAYAVEDHDQAFIPSGGVVGAGGVGQMMVDVVNLVGGESWQVLVHLRKQFLARENFLVLLGGSRVQPEGGFVGRIVKAVGNLVDVGGFQAGGLQAVADSANREVTGMLFAAEALFGGSSDNLAVDHQHRSRIVTLGNSVFAFFQARPMLLLEAYRVLESTDADYFRHVQQSPLDS
nr:hypothetical protein [Bradyrhizobium valentinum]